MFAARILPFCNAKQKFIYGPVAFFSQLLRKKVNWEQEEQEEEERSTNDSLT